MLLLRYDYFYCVSKKKEILLFFIPRILTIPNKCAVIYCCSGYKSKSSNTKVNPRKLTSETTIYNKENSVFVFPDAVKRPELRKKWIKFVYRKNWFPTEHSGVCSPHFDPKFIKYGVRITLIYDLNPIPTIYSDDAVKKNSIFSVIIYSRSIKKISH